MQTLLAWENAIDDAAITADSEAGSLIAANLSDPSLKRPWRAASTSAYFTAVFAADTSIDTLLLAGATLASGDSIRHRLYDASSTLLLDETVDAGTVTDYGLHLYTLNAPVTAASWRCDITATSRTSQGYFDIGRALAAPSWRPAIGMSPGWADGLEDKTPVARGQYSGVIFTGTGPRYRTLSVALNYMDDDDRQSALDLARATGLRNQFLLVPDIDGDWARQALLGHRTQMSPVTEPGMFAPPVYAVSFQMEEDL